MSRKRALVWGVIGGCIVGCTMVQLGMTLEDAHSDALPVYYVVHWPTLPLLKRSSAFYHFVTIIVGYWIIIGTATGLLVSLLHNWRAQRPRNHVA